MQDRRDNSAIFERMNQNKEESNKKINELNIKQASMGEKLINIEQSTKRIENKLDDFINCADLKYANKKMVEEQLKTLERDRIGRLEKAVYGVAFMIVTAVIGALLGLVILK